MSAKGVLGLAGLLLCSAVLQAADAAPSVEIARAQPAALSADGPALAAGSRIEAGDTVVVRWSGIPESAREVELLLSVDGGRTFSLRLTDELEPGSGSFLWKVPALETVTARVALRMGIASSDREREGASDRFREGGEESETEEIVAASSETFTIYGSGAMPRPRLRWKQREIWADAGEAHETSDAASPLDRGLTRSSDELASASDAADAVETSPLASSDAPSTARRFSAVSTRVSPAPAGAERTRAPLTVPPRI